MCSRLLWSSRTEARLVSLAVLAALAITGAPRPAAARQNVPAPTPAAVPSAPPTRAEFDALQAELRRQKDLIMQILRMEQDRYDFLLKLIQGGGAPPDAPPPLPGIPSPAPLPSTGKARPARTAATTRVHEPVVTATISGHVSLPDSAAGETYVYVENVRGPVAKGAALEIKQQGKAFIPRVLAVQRGTTVTFPNRDPVFHNVFSPSPTQPFDLGSYRAGDVSGKVTLRNPGVVEIYCNMHAKMRASVLVVPNALFTKVGAGGKFVLRDVPVGSRRVVAWSPDAVPTLKTVELTPAGVDVELTLEATASAPHNNKHGQPYGSYNE